MDSHEDPIVRSDLPIFVKWMDFVKWLLQTTDGFPKSARFTFSERLIKLALDIVEDLVEARYSRKKSIPLRHANLCLEKLRVLMRICFEMKLLSHKSFAYSAKSMNEVGRMLGGWMKQTPGDEN